VKIKHVGNLFLFLLILIIIISCGLGSDREKGNTAEKLIPAVEAVKAGYGALPLTERLTGVVKAKNQVAIYAQVSAPIVEVYVRDGEYVDKGQPLLRLRDKELYERLRQSRAAYQIAKAQARQAEARLKEVQAEFARTKALAEEQLTSTADLETIESRAVSAEADVELARARIEQAEATFEEREQALSQTVIRAPVSGSIGNRNAEVGMLVSSNTRLFTLGQLDEVEIEIILTDRMLNYIETGQRVEVFTDNPDSDPINGFISRISPFLHPVTHSTEAEIDLKNPERQLKSGMFVAVDVHYGESEQATLVPLAALFENPVTGETGIYVTNDTLNQESASIISNGENIMLTQPVSFDFLPVDVLAKGRMEAGVRGIKPDTWMITLGQDLLNGGSGMARVRMVNREWVYELQRLQRQDLLKEVMQQQQISNLDSLSSERPSTRQR
jgi:RND family efflux transporter MFP subunit